jgi:predicted phosphate transport protein (TIGR00153 family)
MALRLTPRDDRFYTMFATAATNLVTGASLLAEQISAKVDERPEVAARMRDAEHAGDDVTHDIFSTVNATFVTPFDREDIYQLAGRLDDVLDHMDAAADLIVLYRPAEIPTEVCQQVDVLARAAGLTAEAMARLRTPQDLSDFWIEINRLENEADRIHQRAVGQLFDEERDPVVIIKWKEILDLLEDATDRCEDVANLLENVVVKHG